MLSTMLHNVIHNSGYCAALYMMAWDSSPGPFFVLGTFILIWLRGCVDKCPNG